MLLSCSDISGQISHIVLNFSRVESRLLLLVFAVLLSVNDDFQFNEHSHCFLTLFVDNMRTLEHCACWTHVSCHGYMSKE